MDEDIKIEIIDPENPRLGVLRTSTRSQQDDGDSTEIQKKDIEHKVQIGTWITLSLPASGSFENQPLLKVLNNIRSMPIIKEIWVSVVNRATRAEPLDFLMVQKEYAKNGLILCDTQGELSSDFKNSLEALNVNYPFSLYDANEGNKLLAVISARRNLRDEQTKMHKAEITAARLGYWVSGVTPFGFKKIRNQTEHGKRLFLIKSDGFEHVWMEKIFDLALKKVSKTVIVDEVNKLGYRSKTRSIRDQFSKSIVTGIRGNKQLTIKQLDKFLLEPIYCGIRDSKSQQTAGKPIKIHGEFYLTFDQFNQINEGKTRIIETNEGVKIIRGKYLERFIKGTKTDNYPFRKYVLCPICKSNPYGSAPLNKMKRHIPRYHCQKGHKYWSVNKEKFDKTILEFTQNLKITDEKLVELKSLALERTQTKLVTLHGVAIQHGQKVEMLTREAQLLVQKIKNTKFLEVQEELEKELESVKDHRDAAIKDRDSAEKETINLEMVVDRVVYFLKHLDKGLLGIADPNKRAAAWSSIFRELPTYEELESGTPAIAKLRAHIEAIATSENNKIFDVGIKGRNWNTMSMHMISHYLMLDKIGFQIII